MSIESDPLQTQFTRLAKLYKHKDYSATIEETKLILGRHANKNLLYLLLGLCHIQLDEADRAYPFLTKVLDQDPYFIQALLASAYLDLKRGEESTALFKYTRCINLKKETKRVKKILDVLKKSKSLDHVLLAHPNHFFVDFNFHVPGLKKRPLSKWFWYSLPLFLLLVIGVSAWHWLLDEEKVPAVHSPAVLPQNIEEVELYTDDIPYPKDISPNRLAKDFTLLKTHIHQRNFNQAIRLYNQVMSMELDLRLKERFYLLFQFLPNPNFETFENNPKINKILGDPLYLSAFVKMTGFISRQNGSHIHFNVLENQKIAHTVFIYFDESSEFLNQDGMKYTLLARYRGFDGDRKMYRFEGLGIRAIK